VKPEPYGVLYRELFGKVKPEPYGVLYRELFGKVKPEPYGVLYLELFGMVELEPYGDFVLEHHERVEGAEAQGDQQVENASWALTVLVVVVAIMSVICYKLVEEMVKAILQQRRRGTVEILVENREVQTTSEETEQEIRRRVWEEVRRDLRLERLQQRHREEQEMEEEDFRVESRSASQSSESSSSGVRLRQRRHDTPRPMGSIVETPMARQEEPQR
ncbi:unnamed protein product, partial [Effrenium voratum]